MRGLLAWIGGIGLLGLVLVVGIAGLRWAWRTQTARGRLWVSGETIAKEVGGTVVILTPGSTQGKVLKGGAWHPDAPRDLIQWSVEMIPSGELRGTDIFIPADSLRGLLGSQVLCDRLESHCVLTVMLGDRTLNFPDVEFSQDLITTGTFSPEWAYGPHGYGEAMVSAREVFTQFGWKVTWDDRARQLVAVCPRPEWEIPPQPCH